MKRNFWFSIVIVFFPFLSPGQVAKPTTICNPLNISYRFCLDQPSRREAADPAVVTFKGEYFLFASKSGGYWHSTDLISWNFITSSDLPFEDYAPAVVVIKDAVYFMASSSNGPSKIYKTSEPKAGKWEVVNAAFSIAMTDPDLFLDDDGRLYFYYGCSNTDPIFGVELDSKTFMPIGKPVACFNSNYNDYGWERPGDFNEKLQAPWMEGAWMTKYKGKYYLQYAVPGTEFKSYADGLYIADKPLGPFKVAENNPFSSKPEGFIAGAGHSSTFQDRYGNYWHIATMTISVKHPFERRLGLFPAFFDDPAQPYTYTGYGDFPYRIPQEKVSDPSALFPNWMLLSFNKPVQVSSSLQDHPENNAVDENIRTYWSAETGNSNEWISIDLQKQCVINAVQLNFAEHNTHVLGRLPGLFYQYILEYSQDNKTWKTLTDKTLDKTDLPHDYIELASPVKARFLRLTNVHVPDGDFALSGFRVFGDAPGSSPQEVSKFSAARNPKDRCEVKLTWRPDKSAIGYNIRYGTQPDKLYLNYEVLSKDSLTIRSLNAFSEYYFTIDAFNESGIKKNTKTIHIN